MALQKAKANHWKAWLENIDSKDVWMAGRYSKNALSDGGKAHIPTLVKRGQNRGILEEACSDAEKSQFFTEVFFP